MNPIKKGNLFVIFLIAIVAFGSSTVVASLTGSYIDLSILSSINNTDKLAIIADGNFSQLYINKVEIVNTTNNTTNITSIINDANNTLDDFNNIINSN